MNKQIDILELLEGKKKLKKISLDRLYEMESKYPFSSIVNVLINKKQLKTRGNLSLLQMANLVSKTNNPGLAFALVLEDFVPVKDMRDLQKKGKKKRAEISKKKKKGKRKSKPEESDKVKLGAGIASEKLAEIYLKQGMKKEAIEMYKALSLQNPKKSAYFAKILKKIKKQ